MTPDPATRERMLERIKREQAARARWGAFSGLVPAAAGLMVLVGIVVFYQILMNGALPTGEAELTSISAAMPDIIITEPPAGTEQDWAQWYAEQTPDKSSNEATLLALLYDEARETSAQFGEGIHSLVIDSNAEHIVIQAGAEFRVDYPQWVEDEYYCYEKNGTLYVKANRDRMLTYRDGSTTINMGDWVNFLLKKHNISTLTRTVVVTVPEGVELEAISADCLGTLSITGVKAAEVRGNFHDGATLEAVDIRELSPNVFAGVLKLTDSRIVTLEANHYDGGATIRDNQIETLRLNLYSGTFYAEENTIETIELKAYGGSSTFKNNYVSKEIGMATYGALVSIYLPETLSAYRFETGEIGTVYVNDALYDPLESAFSDTGVLIRYACYSAQIDWLESLTSHNYVSALYIWD